MTSQDSKPEESLPNYPNNTAAFGRIMHRLRGNQGDIQSAVRALVPETADLRAITDDELALVSLVVHETKLVNVPAVTNSVELELGRRSVAVTTQSVAAIRELRASLENLRSATDRWSLMLVVASLLLLLIAILQFVKG